MFEDKEEYEQVKRDPMGLASRGLKGRRKMKVTDCLSVEWKTTSDLAREAGLPLMQARFALMSAAANGGPVESSTRGSEAVWRFKEVFNG